MQIDLRLPVSWNRCTLAQLRAIAEIMTERAFLSSPLRPFDMMEVKIAVFFRLTNIEVVEPLNPRVQVEAQYYLCRMRPYSIEDEGRLWFSVYRFWRSLRSWCIRRICGHDDTFSLYVWQIHSWLSGVPAKGRNRAQPGMLDWLDMTQGNGLLLFLLRNIRRRRSLSLRKVAFRGPAPLMDGFSWQRYRFAQEYMQNYMNAQNHLVKMQRMGRKVAPNDLLKAAKNVDLAKALFLATIYERRITYIDEETGCTVTRFHYQSNQSSDNAPYFRNFPDRDWQLVLLWWSSMMMYLAKMFPKVFKKQPVGKNERQLNPLEIYTRTTATMEKYLSMTARDVDREPYTTILQQLEDISRHNEEMERINKQMKSKKK